jgi:hypothetical protein
MTLQQQQTLVLENQENQKIILENQDKLFSTTQVYRLSIDFYFKE